MKVSNKSIEKEAELRYEQYPNAEISYHNVHFEEQQDAFIAGCNWIQSKKGITVNCATIEQLDAFIAGCNWIQSKKGITVNCATIEQLEGLKEISLENVKMLDELIENKLQNETN